MNSRELELAGKIVANLSDDLLKPVYRREPNRHPTRGHCYVASEALWHLLGARESGLLPWQGGGHWWLVRVDSGERVDITAAQFPDGPPYHLGRRCAFLTKQPSKAQELMRRVADA